MREPQLRRGRGAQRVEHLRVEVSLRCRQDRCQLLGRACADERHESVCGAAPQEPAQRRGERREPRLRRDAGNRFGHRAQGCRQRLGLAPRGGRPAGQCARGQRTPADRSETQRVGHRQQLAFGVARGETVFDLHGGGHRPAAQFRHRHRPRDQPSRRIGEAEMADLARRDKGIERLDDLGHRSRAVPVMQPEDVDVIGAETTQALVQRADHRARGVAAGEDMTAGRRGILGRNDEIVALPLEEVADDLLRGAARVVRRRVEQRPTGPGKAVEDLTRSLGRYAPVFGFPEIQGPEADFRDPQAGRAEKLVPHAALPQARHAAKLVRRATQASIIGLGRQAIGSSFASSFRPASTSSGPSVSA